MNAEAAVNRLFICKQAPVQAAGFMQDLQHSIVQLNSKREPDIAASALTAFRARPLDLVW